MAFRTINGRAYSENGWRFVTHDECDTGVVPGTPLRLPIRRGIANLILKGWCAYYHREIESLNNHRGYTDEGGWTPTNTVSTSNHLAGTAVDLNWDSHPFQVRGTFTQAKLGLIRRGQQLFEGTIFWGGDWRSPIDEMHWQLAFPEGDARNAAFASKLAAGYLNIWGHSGAPIPEPDIPGSAPLLLRRGSTGEPVKRLQSGLNSEFPRYSELVVDGIYGPATEGVVKQFQLRSGILADGIVGPKTLAELEKYGIDPAGWITLRNELIGI